MTSRLCRDWIKDVLKKCKAIRGFFSPACRQVKLYSFTLIELLVVIAIIAILAAMLLPALQQARERGKSAKCMANLKTVGAGVLNYCDAYNDHMPIDSGYTEYGSFWQSAFAKLKLIDVQEANSASPIPKGVYNCPAETYPKLMKSATAYDGVWNSYKGCAYGINRYLARYYKGASNTYAYSVPRKIVVVRFPSVTMAMADKGGATNPANEDKRCQTTARARAGTIAERHSGSWNYATLDGGVKSRKKYPCRWQSEDYTDWLFAPTDWTKK